MKVVPNPEPSYGNRDQEISSIELAADVGSAPRFNSSALTRGPDADASRGPSTAKKTRTQRLLAIFQALLWVALLALHIFCVAFYGSVAYVYHNFLSTALSIQIASYKLTINPTYFPVVVTLNGVFSASHLVCFIEMILRSVSARELVFHRTQNIDRAVAFSTHSSRKSTITDKLHQLRTATVTRMNLDTNSTICLKTKSFARRANAVWDSSFGRAGVFGIDGKYFSIFFLIRETVECILQSIQAAQMSNNVPRVWFNRFGVIIVAVNCWTTPIVQYLFKHDPRLELMLCLLFDVISDAISSVGVTTILAASYIPDYDTSITSFSLTKCWQNPVWYAYMMTEFRQLFVQSWFDLASRFLFALTMILSMDDVKILASAADSIVERHEDRASETRLQLWNRRVEKIIHVAMVSWGFIIIGIHTEASTGPSVPECAVTLNPWVKAKPACSCMQINCMARATPIMGTAAEIDAIWAPIEPKRLMVLNIVACPGLHLPHSFQSFYGLRAVDIVASEILRWEKEAALTHTHHPNMHHLALAFTKFSAYGNGSTLPPGLVDPDFPKYLLDMFIGASGISDLPNNLHSIWPNGGMNFLVPKNRFETVPDVVMRMDLDRLNLDFNMIRELPAELFELGRLRWLDVEHNPLTSFPSGVVPSSALSIINFAMTNATALPDWMTTSSYLKHITLYGAHTPLCLNGSTESAIRSHLNCQVPPVVLMHE